MVKWRPLYKIMGRKDVLLPRREVPERAGQTESAARVTGAAPTGESLAPAEAVPSTEWLEGGLALLDSSRLIIHASEALARWLAVTTDHLRGAFFDEVLQQRWPECAPFLVRAWAEALPCAGTDCRRRSM